MSSWSNDCGRLESKAALRKGQVCCGQGCGWKIGISEQLLQAAGNCGVVSANKIIHQFGGDCSQDVVAAGAGTKQQEEPRGLQVIQGRDALKQLLVALAGELELVPDVGLRAHGCAKDCQSLLVAGQTLVTNPHICA
jgi:hypothetical protein